MVECKGLLSKLLVAVYCFQTGFLLKLIIEKARSYDVKVDYPMQLVDPDNLKKCRNGYEKMRVDFCQSTANYLINAELLSDSFNLDRICYLGGRHMDCVGSLLFKSRDTRLHEYRSLFSLFCQRDCQRQLKNCKGLRYPKKGDCKLYDCVVDGVAKCNNRSSHLLTKYSYLKDLCKRDNSLEMTN
ncbi:DgyrCDS13671 [Dimorphilus gyrociliatus]|uniref:DgyrCDS13671 n=1 Tax=Dimorphilus gyrociliatus TaxID=2664684 RepID=A0A7I8WBD1_9ANNE|nr:DgyrCDS13671 [Dimorphilus gyrociliatus]